MSPKQSHGQMAQKVLYGRFPKIVEQNDTKNSWSWLRNTDIKGETEGLLTAAKINASIDATTETRYLVRISIVCVVYTIKQTKLCHK